MYIENTRSYWNDIYSKCIFSKKKKRKKEKREMVYSSSRYFKHVVIVSVKNVLAE